MRYIAVFPTLTAAQRAARRLNTAAIPAEAVKVDSSRTRRGCSWGTAFPANQLDSVRVVFSNASITAREYLPEEYVTGGHF